MNTPHFLTKIFNQPAFTREESEKIIAHFKKVTFIKNDFLLKPGKTANHYWFVESGFIRAYAVDTEGNDISTDFFTTGDIVIDWPSFFLREYIQALTDCICWQLDFETFQQLFHSIEPSGRPAEQDWWVATLNSKNTTFL